MDIALTRDVSRSIERCELTFLDRTPIDYPRAVAQHRDYCDGLAALGLEVLRLPADEAFPDACFVEDTAVVLDEVAILTRPGAVSRRGEVAAIEAALAPFRRIERIEAPATLEGGDVLVMGRRIFVGATTRTNPAGIRALREITAPFGYRVIPVGVPGCLHLKSATSAVDDETLLANRAWLDPEPLSGLRILDVAPEEPGATNLLRVRGEIWAHSGYPRTLDVLDRAGYRITPLDISEFVKAEGSLTCKSLLFRQA
jgi:dimethylargininase